jgi:hypothetical protein
MKPAVAILALVPARKCGSQPFERVNVINAIEDRAWLIRQIGQKAKRKQEWH